jgi:hypothetical protein
MPPLEEIGIGVKPMKQAEREIEDSRNIAKRAWLDFASRL